MHTGLGRPLARDPVHFVGIGGAGMAVLAELLIELGYRISGSDLKDSRNVRRLAERGARVAVGTHRAENVDGANVVVWSAAVPATNPEVLRAGELGLEVISRAELLGRLLDAGRGVAVSGTHGKTTTSSMLARALGAAGLAPSYVIGGDLNDVGSGARLGHSDLVVAEADEAYGSFLHLRPALAVVTNVDVDHLDHYQTPAAIDDAFARFLDQRLEGAAAVLCADDEGVARLRPRVREPVLLYGFGPEADLRLSAGEGRWEVGWRGRRLGSMRLRLPGRHNALNAAGALAAAIVLEAYPAKVIAALESFAGVERRFSLRGEREGVLVVDDYAHHPREVQATLRAAREAYPSARVVALFQPHLYSRTLQLAGQFGEAFADADVLVVTDVYGAREMPMPGVSGRLVCDAVRRASPNTTAAYVPRLEDAAGFVAGLARPGDVVLTLGAGDVTTAAGRILALLGDGP